MNINTKQDLFNLIESGKIKQAKKNCEGLLNSAESWKFKRRLKSEEKANNNEKNKVIEDKEMGRREYGLSKNPKGKIFKLGLTVEKVKEIMDELNQKKQM